jgi:hypothetical protein
VRSDRAAQRALENMADLFRADGDARQMAPLEDEVALPAPLNWSSCAWDRLQVAWHITKPADALIRRW